MGCSFKIRVVKSGEKREGSGTTMGVNDGVPTDF